MTLSERWLASEQRYTMSYERWLEYVATDAERDARRYRKLRDEAEKGGYLDTRDWNWERANDTPTLDAAVDVLEGGK